MRLNPDGVGRSTLHRCLTSVVSPRPIGWISTLSTDGVPNLGPFSYFNVVSTDRPVVMFSPRERDDGSQKDTLRNVLDTGEFVANMVTVSHLEAMDRTASHLDPAADEFEYAGLEKTASAEVAPPRVADAPAAMECVLYDSLNVYSNTVVFGEVVSIYVAEAICTDGKIDMRKIDTVGRLGGPFYSGVEILDVKRSEG